MDRRTSWFLHPVLLRVYQFLGVEIIGNITRWDYLFLERGTRNGSSNFTWMQVRQRPHSGELVFDGVARGSGSRVDVKLVENGSYVPLHRAWANHQPFSYSAVTQTLSDKAQHFHLSRGQFIWVRLRC